MKKILFNVTAALILAGLGGFILRTYPGTVGLCMGAGCVIGALGIAFPTQMQTGAVTFKGLLVLVLPTVFGALPGGSRKSDPPADAPKDGVL